MTERKSRVVTERNKPNAWCQLVQQLLPDYLHYDLTGVEMQQFQAHLAQCDSCAQQVQEARLLDADLQAEADRHRPQLSRQASLRIQNQVYRRMQRSLVWQRTGQFLRVSTAVAAMILLLGGGVLFGRFWLPYLATEDNIAGETSEFPDLPPLGPTAVPTAAPTIPIPAPVEIEEEAPIPNLTTESNPRFNAWDHWTAAAPGQTPEELAATIMTAALSQDTAYLNELFVGMGASQQPTARMWLRLSNNCQSIIQSDDFLFARHPIPLRNVTAVSIWYNGHLVGEIKMRQVQGEWFATFTRTPAINPCLP